MATTDSLKFITVTTPEAVSRIADNVTGTVRKGPHNLFQGTPMYAGSVKQDARKTGRYKLQLPVLEDFCSLLKHIINIFKLEFLYLTHMKHLKMSLII